MPTPHATNTAPRARFVSAERLNTLGLGLTELEMLLNFLDGQEAGQAPVRREFARWPFRQSGVNVHFTHPGGSETVLRLAGRNISRGGMSLLHNGYIHPGTKCRVELARAAGGTMDCRGSVARCQHRRGTLHEIGIKFDQPVRLRDLVGENGRAIYSYEKIDPALLRGRVLVAESNPLDARIIGHFLRETSLNLDVCATVAECRAKASERYDLVLLDAGMTGESPIELLRHLRAQGVHAPALLMSDHPASLMKEGLWDVANVGVVAKPLVQHKLLQQIAERLLIEEQPSAPAPATATSGGRGGATRGDVSRLEAALVQAQGAGDAGASLDAAMKLRDLALTLRLEALVNAADAAIAALPRLKSLAEDPRPVAELLAACRRVQAAA